jgi:hypothetical protein|tara:strand:+ start:72 stop:521 length:450 start_codon:yes stop_codon:yes gene_type:complete
MTKTKVTEWNAKALLAKSAVALREFSQQVKVESDNQVKKVQYPWPVSTKRKNGKLVKRGKRDIVDTGFLLNSASAPKVFKTKTGAALTITWNAPYSLEVALGGYTLRQGRSDEYTAPSRNYVLKTYREMRSDGSIPFAEFFANSWKNVK